MSPADFNTHTKERYAANEGHPESKMPQISSHLSTTFNLRGKSKPQRKKSAPALTTSKGEYDNVCAQALQPAPLKTPKSAKTHVTREQMIEYLRKQIKQLKDESAYHIQMLGASTRLLEVVNRCSEELGGGVLEFKETQKRLNEEYYSVIRQGER